VQEQRDWCRGRCSHCHSPGHQHDADIAEPGLLFVSYLLVVQPGNDIFHLCEVSAKRKRGASPFDGEKVFHSVVDPEVTVCFVWSG